MTTRQPHPLDTHDSARLSEQDIARRDRLLADLRSSLARRTRRRRVIHTSALACFIAGALGAALLLPRSTQTASPSPDPSPVAAHPAPSGLRIQHVRTDPTLADRLATSTPRHSIDIVDDQALADALRRAGSPGIIRVQGRVLLTSDAPGLPTPPLDPQATPPSFPPVPPDPDQTTT